MRPIIHVTSTNIVMWAVIGLITVVIGLILVATENSY